MLRRSSGSRFEAPPRSVGLSLLGVLACLAVLPIAVIAERHRDDTITTARSRIVRLPDGSRALLERGATIEYRRDFATRRALWLFGQAAFEVVRGPTFTVWTETAVVHTSASTFVIRATARESTFVSVRAGFANLRALNEEDDPAFPTVAVGPGQRAFAARTLGAHIVPP